MSKTSKSGFDWQEKALELLHRLGDEARRVVVDPQRRAQLLQDAKERIERLKMDPALGDLVDRLQSALRLVKASARSEYKLRSKKSLYLVVAGLLYLVMPLDVIPDFLPGGFLDDAAVLAFVLAQAAKELERFREWERWRREFQEDEQESS